MGKKSTLLERYGREGQENTRERKTLKRGQTGRSVPLPASGGAKKGAESGASGFVGRIGRKKGRQKEIQETDPDLEAGGRGESAKREERGSGSSVTSQKGEKRPGRER